jgi:hypothetical protein
MVARPLRRAGRRAPSLASLALRVLIAGAPSLAHADVTVPHGRDPSPPRHDGDKPSAPQPPVLGGAAPMPRPPGVMPPPRPPEPPKP